MRRCSASVRASILALDSEIRSSSDCKNKTKNDLESVIHRSGPAAEVGGGASCGGGGAPTLGRHLVIH